MQKLTKSILSAVGVYLLVTCVPFAHSLPKAHANGESAIPQGWESYEVRPDILTVPAQARPVVANWERLKAAHFSFIAELLEMYSKDTHLYFLARDSEHLYDVARLVTEGTPDASRVHLINVSRGNMRDKNLKAYLAENGISDETLQAGKKVLFVDTGFSGTIPRVIGESFPETLRSKLKTHLVVSSNPSHPSSRVFLIHLNSSVIEQHPSSMHGTIVSYEHMPRYTDRSTAFAYVSGRYQPLSPIGKASDGSVSKTESMKYMSDLKAYWQKPEVKARFAFERNQIQSLKESLVNTSPSSIESLRDQYSKFKETTEGQFARAILLDAIDMKNNASLEIKVAFSDLSSNSSTQAHTSSLVHISKKDALMKKNPEWATILENPDDEIPKLFENKDYQMIGNLIDANVDHEINKLLITALFDQPSTELKKQYQNSMIEIGDPNTLQYLAQYTFSQPHTSELKDGIKLMIEKGKPETLQRLARFTFSQPHTSEMADSLKLLIEKGDTRTLQYLAHYTFSQPHTSEMADSLKLLIEKGDPRTLSNLAFYTFSKPHTREMQDLIKLLIERGDSTTLQNLAASAFSNPHTREMQDAIKLLIEKGDPTTLRFLAQRTFSQPHTSDWKGQLKLLVEKCDSDTAKELYSAVFSKLHAQTPEHLLMKRAVAIPDPLERKAWLESELEKMGSSLVASSKKLITPISTAPAKPVSPTLVHGDVVEIRSQRLEVVRPAGEGRRGIVFEVRSAKGARYALKVAKDQEPDTLKSIAEETSKAHAWQKLKIPHAKVLVQEKTYVLKPWIDGVNGKDVFQKLAEGNQTLLPAKKALIKLVRDIQGRGGYVGDFRPPNLIWTGKAWIMIDSGSVQDGKTIEDALKKWSESDERGPKFERRWKMPVPQGLQCVDLFKAP